MRIGVIGINGLGFVTAPTGPDGIMTIQGGAGNDPSTIVPGDTLAGGSTTGPSGSGDTLICPAGYPYDWTIHDCSGYAGSPADVTASEQQASYDVCTSGGGQWSLPLNQCVMPSPGWSNGVLYGAAALIAVLILTRGR